MMIFRLLFLSLLVVFLEPISRADTLDDLARDFWTWRAVEMPVSTDDIPRLDRPPGWIPDWSPAAVESYRGKVSAFEQQWKALDVSKLPIPRQVDYRLIGSAIARAQSAESRWADRMMNGQRPQNLPGESWAITP